MLKNIVLLLFASILATNVNAKNMYDDQFADFDYEFAQQEKNQTQSSDPLNGYNRVMTDFNDALYVNVYRPISKTIDAVVHDKIQEGVSNMYYNVTFPIRFTNDILQLKFDKAIIEIGRFVLNTVFGIFGFFDVAQTHFGLYTTPEDFGQTLGHYGVAAGPHIVLPFLGPSNVRDTISMVPDAYLDPTVYNESRGMNIVNHMDNSIALEVVEQLNYGSMNYEAYDIIRKDAIDLYPYLKNIYEQRRSQLIKE